MALYKKIKATQSGSHFREDMGWFLWDPEGYCNPHPQAWLCPVVAGLYPVADGLAEEGMCPSHPHSPPICLWFNTWQVWLESGASMWLKPRAKTRGRHGLGTHRAVERPPHRKLSQSGSPGLLGEELGKPTSPHNIPCPLLNPHSPWGFAVFRVPKAPRESPIHAPASCPLI